MDTLIQGGKYQVLEVIEAEEGYKACLCIDVETNNDYRPMILNIYEKYEDIRRFLPQFYSLNQEQHAEFICILSGQHSITAVFEYHPGVKLPNFFQNVDKEDFELRCQYASKLLEACLLLDTVPDFMAYACLEPENIIISEKKQNVMINYIIRPLEIGDEPFKWRKLASLLELIFVHNRYVPDKTWEYISELKQNRDDNIVGAFSRWKEISESLLEEHKILKEEKFISYIMRRLKRIIRQRLKRMFSTS
ncbi:MAG: hypothetical protein ACOYIB_07375 [Desulfosporosinus sp.]